MLLIQGATALERLSIATLILSTTRSPLGSSDVQGIFNFLSIAELPKC